ncbi:MAG: diversity-generating retroelement protein Avd [Candidatus Levybacteria bacterium]|nr:diversity-generating retroelement protein Avd [Candidatus Levybacteria bacterium]
MPDFHDSLKKVPLFVKTYELYKSFYIYVQLFPRKDRYTLGQKCETLLLEILEAVIVASSLSKQDKLPILKRASAKIDVLRVLFTLGRDLKIIEIKKHQIFENSLQEIGRMFGGWIKSTGQT